MGKALQKARAFENKYLPYASKTDQPAFHVTAGIGWINDPNGFSVYKGEYHLFFQYYPFDTKWGPMHWGHAKTKDFVRWERLPCALAPEEDYDKNGCFSGSAIEMPDGRQLLIYTGVKQIRRRSGDVKDYQTQCIAIGDGVDYEKYEGNPVIPAQLIPKGNSVHDFRDPKIWYENGKYYIVVGNRAPDESGSILMYESEDAINWQFYGTLASCHNQYGKMWECPDFFPLDGKHVLITSPQEMGSVGLEFHAGNANACFIGEYDREARHMLRENAQAVDYGLDFYAPQTLLTPDGRRVMIAWMQNWETYYCKPKYLKYCGMMTLPRELRVVNDRLVQNPVREIEQFRRTKVSYHDVMVSGETNLSGVNGRFIDMTVKVRPISESNMYKWFKLNLAKDGECVTSIRFKPDTNIIRFDRSRSGFHHDIVSMREFPVRSEKGEIKLRVIMDRFSIELFVNDGEQAASSVIYTPIEAKSISFASDVPVMIDVEKYDLVVE